MRTGFPAAGYRDLNQAIVSRKPSSSAKPGANPIARAREVSASECFTSPARTGAYTMREELPVMAMIIRASSFTVMLRPQAILYVPVFTA